ncbi:MAG TPA: sulfatase-like hydrolase/transferase [Roseimicrobium sp.]|nr:sulfatase-like hydrolase/transferase [Roseimicrobium sp.]
MMQNPVIVSQESDPLDRRRIGRRQVLSAIGAGTLAMLSAGCMGGSNASPSLSEKTTLGETTSRPNFLFVLSDQHRHDWLGCAGTVPVRTPNLDALATAGTRFTRLYCSSPVCGPSRACLASGLDYDRCGVPNHAVNYPVERPTYYRVLRDAGYHVMGCGKFDLHKATHDWGIDGQHLLREWGFSAGIDNAGKRDALSGTPQHPRDPYLKYLCDRGLAEAHIADFKSRQDYLSTGPTPLDDAAYCDNWIGRQALHLLQDKPTGQPWHLVVNFAGPHEPMDVTADMYEWYRRPAVSFPQPIDGDPRYAPEQHQQIRSNYAAMVQNIDRWVGVFLQHLRERQQLETTIVVYSSDHGEMLGDHRRWGKCVPYEAAVRVPLIVAGPGVRQGVVVDSLASHIDIGATFLDYAAAKQLPDVDSRSLRPQLAGAGNPDRPYVSSGLGPWRMVSDGRYKLAVGFQATMTTPEIMRSRTIGTQTLLWDLHADPAETRDLAANQPAVVARLSALLPQRVPSGE